jgi:hypothetical protein
MLPGKSFAQSVEENLKAFRIGRRQDQKRASAVYRANRSIEVDEFANKLGMSTKYVASKEQLSRAKGLGKPPETEDFRNRGDPQGELR